jgi:hypothetical protein
MGLQKLHLVRQDASALKIDVLGVGGHEGYSKELHARLLGRAPRLVIVAALAGGNHIAPMIGPVLA